MKRQIACKKDAIRATEMLLANIDTLYEDFLDHAKALDGIFICKEHDDEWDDFEETLEELESSLTQFTSEVRRMPR